MFRELLQVTGPIFFLGMQLSSVQVALGIVRDKRVKQLSSLPFISLLVNSVVWSAYGLVRSDLTVLVPNICGIVSGLFCTACYVKYAHQAPWTLLSASGLICLVSIFFMQAGNDFILGSIGCILSVLVMGSPLATLRTVVQEKSTASMPLMVSLTAWCNSLSWTLYGLIVAHDVMVEKENCEIMCPKMHLCAVFHLS